MRASPPLISLALALGACAPSVVGDGPKSTAGTDAGPADSGPAADSGTRDSGAGDGGAGDGGAGDGGDDGGAGTPQLSSLVTSEALLAQLDALQEVAAAHADTRETFGPGYTASVAHAVAVLEAAGYTVELEPFEMRGFSETAPPELALLSPTATSFVAGTDHATLTWSGAGEAEGPVVAVDLVLPPTASSSSTSGCEAADFADFPPGAIALVQRGGCTFSTKVARAEAAGALAVVIFNEGQSDRQGLEGWTLDEGAPASVPVVGTRFDVGEALAAAAAAGPATLRVATFVRGGTFTIHNVLAETPTGDPARTLVVGAHLDSVAAGPGINDNGTGTAFVLAAATAWAESGLVATNRIRWALWGAEEVGLVGSTAHVDALDRDERDAILANLNYDMIGSPNGARFVYDGDGSATGGVGPLGSDTIEALHTDWLEAQGLDWEPTPFDGRSDYGPFIWAGIPAGGLFSGAETRKGRALAERFGGDPDAPLDACYHRACDDRGNVDPVLFAELSATAAHVVQTLAAWEGPLGSPSAARVPVARPTGPLPAAHGHGHGCGPVLR